MKNRIIVSRYDSPCGELAIGSLDDKLCLCDWREEKNRDHIDRRLAKIFNAEFIHDTSSVTDNAKRQLDEYFEGMRRTFDIPLILAGTGFQETIWKGLLTIPYGCTVSYSSMAELVGRPKSVRAVANANGANAISIFIPCHRVVGSDGTLTGYGGGLKAKDYLLKLERT